MTSPAPLTEPLPSAGREASEPRGEPQRIEVGWMLVGPLDAIDREAAERARDMVREYLQSLFPEFRWVMPLERREELSTGLQAEPVVLFEQELIERDARRWDFVLLITASDLVSHYKPFALAALSRSYEVGAISTARIDPGLTEETSRRTVVLARRIAVLAIHHLGHLNGLDHVEDPDNYLFDVSAVEDLDRMHELTAAQAAAARASLAETADLRLEEQEEYRHAHPLRFYWRSLWVNRRPVWDAVIEARPWQFPLRLSGLTTAALSVMLILLMTAEVWDLGTMQSGPVVAGLSLAALLATTCYVIARQKLLIRRDRGRLSELKVVRNVSTFLIVLSGMVTTYVVLLVLTLSLSWLLFDESIAREWTAAGEASLSAGQYVVLAAFIASFGIFIGALGLSFEDQHYFRHVTYVDEET